MSSIQHIKWPGKSSFESKVNKSIDAANQILTIRGDETFIRTDKKPGLLMISLNWPAVLARMPRFNGGSGVSVLVAQTSYIALGIYNGNFVTGDPTSTTLDGTTHLPLGMSLGDACLIVNQAEWQTTDAPLNPPGVIPGVQRGSQSGVPIVFVVAADGIEDCIPCAGGSGSGSG